MSGTPGVFLDRDGTLVRDVNYLRRRDQLEILPRAPEAIRVLREHGLRVVVITNQSGVARGLLSEDDLRDIHRELERRLADSGALLDGIYYCPHHPTEGAEPYRVSCDCRKPGIALAQRAARALGLNPALSYVVGDQASDMQLAARLGAKGILIRNSNETLAQDAVDNAMAVACVAADLWKAAEWIVDDLRR
jgi:D-glycero-D-manno-heptose 1,7-bisphosphate phosphatase